jgi:transcriptional regulator with XRE-family HTH domain
MTPHEFRAMRERNGWTQLELARLMKVALGVISGIERGTDVPTRYEFALRWLDFLETRRRGEEIARSEVIG